MGLTTAEMAPMKYTAKIGLLNIYT